MPAAKPSLELLRELSDENVLHALLDAPRLTRAEIAGRTGISKPTVAESVRRLAAAGVVVDTGDRTTGPGRVGTYYALAPDVGLALAVDIGPDGVTAELVDAHGDVRVDSVAGVTRPADPTSVATALARASAAVRDRARAPIRLAVVGVADPVDRRTGRLVHLPDSPFLVGELDPAHVLAGLVAGPVVVDNDVNWAARAERAAGGTGGHDDFVLLHLGEGLGAAVVADGEVRRGHGGLAGEVAHVVTTGPDGRTCAFTDVFARLDLRRPGGTAIDVGAVRALLVGRSAAATAGRQALAAAVTGVVAAAVAFADPAVVVLGGPWGAERRLVTAVRELVDASPRPVSVQAATVSTEACLTGVRGAAVAELRTTLTRYRQTLGAPGAGGTTAAPGGRRGGPGRAAGPEDGHPVH